MSDLERQLRAYAQQLDASVPGAQQLADDGVSPAREVERRPRGWLVIGAAAAIVAVAVGSIAILQTLRDDVPQAVGTVTSTVGSPTTTPPTTNGVPTTVAPSEFVTLVSEVPIYGGGADGQVAGMPMVSAGPVVIAADGYHAVFSAGGDRDVWDTVYHATSDDGSDWTVDPEPSVLPGVEGASDLRVGSILELEDGRWAMYYHVAFDVGGHGNHIYEYTIRRATAAKPGGPWTPDPEPVLVPGAEGSWDATSVSNPSVVRDGDLWMMYYAGHASPEGLGEADPSSGMDLAGQGAVGLATSTDGITWTKRADPVFVGRKDLTWEGGAISRPTVARSGDRSVLVYAGRTGGSRGMAVSTDGLVWQRVSDHPILTAVDVPRPAIFSTSLLDDGGTLRLFVSNGGYRTTSSVYEMTLRVP